MLQIYYCPSTEIMQLPNKPWCDISAGNWNPNKHFHISHICRFPNLLMNMWRLAGVDIFQTMAAGFSFTVSPTCTIEQWTIVRWISFTVLPVFTHLHFMWMNFHRIWCITIEIILSLLLWLALEVEFEFVALKFGDQMDSFSRRRGGSEGFM